jgi:hypothetical protein
MEGLEHPWLGPDAIDLIAGDSDILNDVSRNSRLGLCVAISNIVAAAVPIARRAMIIAPQRSSHEAVVMRSYVAAILAITVE